MSDSHGREATDVSRRAFLEGTSAALVIAAATPTVAGQTPATPAAPVREDPDQRDRQRHGAAGRGRGSLDAGRAAARSPRPDRHQDRLRARRVRRLHGAARRQAGLLLQPAGGVGRRPDRPDGRGAGARRRAASAAAGVRRARRAAVRLLHVGPADGGDGAARTQSASDARTRCARRWPATSAAARTTTATSKRSSRSARHGRRRPTAGRTGGAQ